VPTVTGAHRGELATVAPVLCRIGQTGGNGGYANGVDEPASTIVSKAEHLLIAPTLVQTGYGERAGQAARVPGLDKPLGCCVDGQKHAVVAAFIAKHFGGQVGVGADTPLPTTTVRGTQNQVVAANLVRFNHDDAGVPIDGPLPAVTAGGLHAGLVYSFLTKYFGTAIGCPVDLPLPTATAKDRCGVVVVHVAGEPYVIVDVGMRMLSPRELARCQGFPDDYQLPGEQLPGTKSAAVAMVGNSVSPPAAAAIVRANCGAAVMQPAL
jgi:DNA (cytosine-5)-methyltransferase 1